MLKQIFQRYASTMLVICTLGALVFLAVRYYRQNQVLKVKYAALLGTQDKYQQVSSSLAKLQIDYNTQQQLAAKAQATFSEVKRAKDEQIKMLSTAMHAVTEKDQNQGASDFTVQPQGKVPGYTVNEVRIQGSDSPPVGYVLLRNDGSVEKGNYNFSIEVKTLETQDAGDGKIRVFSRAYLVLNENGLADQDQRLKKWKGAEFPLSITGGDAVVDPTETSTQPGFLGWAPHLNIGLNVGGDTQGGFVRPELNFSIAGYGKHVNDLDWKFLQLGVGTDSKLDLVDFHLIPFSYRPLKRWLPNTYVGPGIGTSRLGTNYFLNVSLGF